jgi:hypothetical protein
MSRDSSGESLEAVLASIRRSLAEQATNVLDEEAVVPDEVAAPADMPGDHDAPPLSESLSQRLAASPDASQDAPSILNGTASRGAEARPAPGGIAIASAPPATGAEPAPPASAAPAVVAPAAATPNLAASHTPAPEPAREDPLWFLGHEPDQRGGAHASGGAARQRAIPDGVGGMAPTSEPKPARAAEPKPSRMGALRGPLPPFFGSSAEVVKVEIAPDPPAFSGAGAMPPAAPEPTPAAPPRPIGSAVSPGGDALRSGDLGGGGLEGPQGWPGAGDSALNGKASAIFGPPGAEGRTAGSEASPQMQALEVMVAELLRPMLRRWLDENMPRLVSAALKAEAELMSKRDPKKS